MKTRESVLAYAVYAVEAISLIVGIGLVALGGYQEMTYGIAVLCVVIGVFLFLYGHVRATNLQQEALHSTDRFTPPSQFFSLGWGMVALSLILLAINVFWQC